MLGIEFTVLNDGPGLTGRQKTRENVLWVNKANYGSGPRKVGERAC